MASRNATFYESGVSGALFAPLKWFFYILILLLALMLAAWVVDWIFVFRVWPDGLVSLKNVLTGDLSRTASLGGWHNELNRLAVATANCVYELIFKAPGIHDMGARFADGTALSIPDTIVRNTYIANYQAIQVAMTGTQLFGVRLAVLLMALPLFVLAYVFALSDGLAQRAIRRASGGNESASIYHRAKYYLVALGSALSALYLLLPASIDPRWIILPGISVLGLLVRWQWVYYKKHL